jgi:hypothetical protein
MNPHQVIDWTEERIAELREMVKTMPAGQIAKTWGVNRNVICGKMARLGIKRPEAPITRPRIPTLKPKIERRGGIAPTRLKAAPPLVSQIPHQAPAEATHKRFHKPADIWQLTGSTCRYPLWRDSEPISQKFYCGEVVVEGLPYCDACARVAFSGWAA